MGQATRLIDITVRRLRWRGWTLLLLRERRARDDHDGDVAHDREQFVASGRADSEQEAIGQALAAIHRNGAA